MTFAYSSNFCSASRADRRIVNYVTVIATHKLGKRTSGTQSDFCIQKFKIGRLKYAYKPEGALPKDSAIEESAAYGKKLHKEVSSRHRQAMGGCRNGIGCSRVR